MASSVNSLLGIGAGALYAHQNSIQTTGNNIANVDTEGYSRQGVRYEANPSLTSRPGQIGQGVSAVEVYRMFNRFIEKAYIDKASDSSRWSEQHALLRNVDALVYESDTVPGISNALTNFFNGWHNLSSYPSLMSNREAVLSQAETLAGMIREYDQTLAYMQDQMDGLIQTDVDRANQLIQDIAQLNEQINIHSIPGQNNPNSLLDQRDLKVRKLAEIVDIDIIDKGEGHYTVNTKSGMTLVDEGQAYSFEFLGPRTEKYLVDSTNGYEGTVHFDGADEYEYTLEIVDSGFVDAGATFKMSLDGGKTWLCGDGTYRSMDQVAKLTAGVTDPATLEAYGVKTFDATGSASPAFIKDLQISFDDDLGLGALQTGDRFEIMPKAGVYWNSPTKGLVNVTTQTFDDGTMNNRRIVGGTLGAYFEFRDHLVGEYRERLNTFAKHLGWEVNRIHSQGAGLEKLTSVLGDYKVLHQDQPLGSAYSGLAFADKLQSGNFNIATYDATTGEPLQVAPGMSAILDVNFDPENDSLDDLVANINADAAANGLPITATIIDGRLSIQSTDPDVKFAMGNDTSGVLAALGVNTFFKGESANDFSVRSDLAANLNLINAGAVNGAGEVNEGDSSIALQISQLATKKVSITSHTGKITEQTLNSYYAQLVTKVGADTQQAQHNSALYGSMAGDLQSQQDAISGVNLDEEMTNLVKFQNSYKAAAKLITTADEMLQTILGLKQ